MDPPQNPAGEYVAKTGYSQERRDELIAIIEQAPGALRQAVAGLDDRQLDTRYRNWTIRQIVHHLADSHVHCYVRCKWTITEDLPTIKPYDEGKWSALPDALHGDIGPALALLEGLHARWVQLLRSMSDEQFGRCFYHPELKKALSLSEALTYYAWHCRHHTAQILWVREQRGW
jgi:uncharacterized damage-inducible protein DinB